MALRHANGGLVLIFAAVMTPIINTLTGTKYLSVQHPGLICTRTHNYERDLVSDGRNQIKQHFSLASRALRFCKRLSGEVRWTLRRQADVANIVNPRPCQLREDLEYVTCCLCACRKSSVQSCAKVDATQLFKDASTDKGLQSAAMLLRRVSQNLHCDAIAVRGAAKAEGYVCSRTRRSTLEQTTVSFQNMLRAIVHFTHEGLVRFGSYVVLRKKKKPGLWAGP